MKANKRAMRQQAKQAGLKGGNQRMRVEQQQLPVNDAPSNAKGDQSAVGVLVALLLASVGMLAGGLYWSITNFLHVQATAPGSLSPYLFGLLVMALSVMAARALAWMSLFGSVILGTRMAGWKSVEGICTKGMPFTKIFPGGSAWLSTALVQSLVGRGQYDDALTAADAEWVRTGSDPRQAQNLGSMCFAAGMAQQGKGDMKQAQVWTERAIGVLNKTMEQLQNPKGVMQKLAASQSTQAVGQLRIQLAAAYFSNAGMLFNNQDFRRARENFKLAADYAVKAPDFPQKSDIIKFSNEQLGRLKHS